VFTDSEWSELLADIVTGLWRLRRRVPAGADASGDQTRRIRRDLEALWDRLTEAGLEVRDHTGEAYDPGKSLRVLAFQPTADVQREQVIETLKPTIYCRTQPLQLGEVIVGTPLTAETPDGHGDSEI